MELSEKKQGYHSITINKNSFTIMTLHLIRPALTKGRIRKNKKKDRLKYIELTGSVKPLTESHRSMQLPGNKKTRLSIIWGTIIIMIIVLHVASVLSV
jgi:hypothetical protein